ncbi:hypothetical protein SAMN05444172_6387 [Burkholderia sp. GAS332]|jgi:hypothetical protein|uniref:hypothetical protein n=2 Tax=Burkholderiaceae TaxID=119060 RepID=UPI00092A3C22|nr:hypothetical protein SAMN05444172_6387 [Burkholderia sp. GAS332]
MGFGVQRKAVTQKRQAGAKEAQAGAHGPAKAVWSVKRVEVVIPLLRSNEFEN